MVRQRIIVAANAKKNGGFWQISVILGSPKSRNPSSVQRRSGFRNNSIMKGDFSMAPLVTNDEHNF
jgi:hypothetical protein